jgi:hypothetical protein
MQVSFWNGELREGAIQADQKPPAQLSRRADEKANFEATLRYCQTRCVVKVDEEEILSLGFSPTHEAVELLLYGPDG